VENAPDAQAKGMLLGQMALAYHLDGNVVARDKAIARIKEQFASVQAQIGGQTRNLLDWSQTITAIPAMAPQFKPFTGWPGLGGVADGKGLMSECGQIVFSPNWIHSNPPREDTPKDIPVVPGPGKLAIDKLVAKGGMTSPANSPYQQNQQVILTFKSGHVTVESRINGQQSSLRVPPLIHPIIVDNLVIYRTDKYVVAWDLYTGELAWTSDELPMIDVKRNSTGPYYGYFGFSVADDGRNMITAGGGKVFTLLNFKDSNQNPYNPQPKIESEGNALAALTLGEDGKLAWVIGTGGQKPENELIAACKFVCAPTYSAGRLYTIVTFMESYHLLCLDALTGRMIWQSTISQTPALNRNYGIMIAMPGASSPAVADGKVFALTNAGVIGAFDAQDGQPLWAYQYDSGLNGSRDMNNYYAIKTTMPPNPIIVNRGRLYFLPCDSSELVCLGAQDGDLINRCTRDVRGQGWYQDLTAIDSQRLLLSGDGLAVVNMADFKVTQCRAQGLSTASMAIIGRPAVTSQYVLASGEVNKLGAVLRLDLSKLDNPDQCVQVLNTDPTGLLGNLVSADGKLVAANCLGVAAYINYDIDKSIWAKKLEDATLAQKPAMFKTMGEHAFNAMKYSAALEDFAMCRQAADELAKDPDKAAAAATVTSDLPSWLYRAHVGMGNAASTGQEMFASFTKAMEAAQSNQEKARMLYRLSLCQEKLGDFAAAAALAQELIETYKDEQIPESIKIGPTADPFVRDTAESMSSVQLAKTFGQDIVHRLVTEHGQALYEPFNAKAKEVYDNAVKDGDAKKLEGIVDTWPSSPWAIKGSFAAGELYYRKALAAGKDTPQGQQLLGQAAGCLIRCRAVEDSALKDIRLGAAAGYALAYERVGSSASAALSWLSDDERKETVKFADYNGTLQALLDSLGTGGTMRPPSMLPSMKLKTRPEFAFPDESACLVRDGAGRAVRLGDRLLVKAFQPAMDGTGSGGDRAILLDTVAGSRDAAQAQSGLLGGDANNKVRGGYNPYGYYNSAANTVVGGFSSDGKTFAVVDQQGMIGFDLLSSKIKWQRKDFASLELSDKSKFGPPNTMVLTSSADGLFIIGNQMGKVIAVDIATGTLKWEVSLQAPSVGGPNGAVGTRPSAICKAPQIGGGVVLLCHNGDMKASLCDIGGGKLLKEWGDAAQPQPGRQIQAQLTPDGMLVMLKDGELKVFDAKAIRKAALKETDPAKVEAANAPLWTQKYDTANNNLPRLMDGVPGLIVVQPKTAAPDLEVRSVLTNQVVANIHPEGGFAVTQVFPGAGNDLILICSAAGPQAANNGFIYNYNPQPQFIQPMSTRGLNVQRWDLSGTGKNLWSRTLIDDSSATYVLPAPAIGQNCLFVAARNQQQNMPQMADQPVAGYLLDMEKGQLRDQIELNEKKAGATKSARMGVIGAAEMTNGRLCVEAGEGIRVYAGQ
jgi:outer membrane protein assembly factor BamB